MPFRVIAKPAPATPASCGNLARHCPPSLWEFVVLSFRNWVVPSIIRGDRCGRPPWPAPPHSATLRFSPSSLREARVRLWTTQRRAPARRRSLGGPSPYPPLILSSEFTLNSPKGRIIRSPSKAAHPGVLISSLRGPVQICLTRTDPVLSRPRELTSLRQDRIICMYALTCI
jgi:hypothetical protein